MNETNWTTAPEGATHRERKGLRRFYKKTGVAELSFWSPVSKRWFVAQHTSVLRLDKMETRPMNETNWSEWLPYDGSGQPVGDDVLVQVRLQEEENARGPRSGDRWDWSVGSGGCDITHYRYDLDHPDASKPTLPVTPEKEAWEEGERRMRNISGNGNTGEHYEQPQPYWMDDREDDLAFLAVQIAEWPEGICTHAYRCQEDGEIKFCRLHQAMTEDLPAFAREEISANRARIGMQPFIVELQYDPKEVAFSRRSDGSTASYYQLPEGAKELQHLISHRDMNAQIGEIFRAAYRYGQASHSDKLRDAKKIKFYIDAEIARLEAL